MRLQSTARENVRSMYEERT